MTSGDKCAQPGLYNRVITFAMFGPGANQMTRNIEIFSEALKYN